MGSERRSRLAKQVDLALERESVFATAEFKRTATGVFCHWIVSGKSATGLPAMLLDMAIPLSGKDESALLAEAELFADKFIVPMAAYLSSTGGASSHVPSLTVDKRRHLFEGHMAYHFAPQRSGNLTLQKQTEALFNMAAFLQVVAPLKSIADFQNVAVGTVESRVKKGRASGAIPKASEVRARKEILKRG